MCHAKKPKKMLRHMPQRKLGTEVRVYGIGKFIMPVSPRKKLKIYQENTHG
jgi:hypothetical protein